MNDFIIICDSKIIQKNKAIWLERTGGKLESLNSSNIYETLKYNPIYFVENHNSQKTKELIQKFDINCLFNVGTPRKISEDLIKFVDHGILNVHPGVLPKYRGCSAVEWSLYIMTLLETQFIIWMLIMIQAQLFMLKHIKYLKIKIIKIFEIWFI